jgi:anti-sigma-K factor RskA
VDKDIGQLLSFYVNGTLTGPERERVETALRDDAQARALLDWEKALRRSVQNDPQFDIAEDRGLAQVMQRIRAETKSAAAAAPRRAPRADTFARFREFFRWSPALALACGVMAVQFGVIVHLTGLRGEESEYSGVRTMITRHSETFVRVAFKPEATENDLRTLVRSVDAEIVAGPSQIGDYYLVVPAKNAEAALKTLQSSTSVESAEVVRALPSRPS